MLADLFHDVRNRCFLVPDSSVCPFERPEVGKNQSFEHQASASRTTLPPLVRSDVTDKGTGAAPASEIESLKHIGRLVWVHVSAKQNIFESPISIIRRVMCSGAKSMLDMRTRTLEQMS
jgi:hypothetical protein